MPPALHEAAVARQVFVAASLGYSGSLQTIGASHAGGLTDVFQNQDRGELVH